jgi:hypothetical protein
METTNTCNYRVLHVWWSLAECGWSMWHVYYQTKARIYAMRIRSASIAKRCEFSSGALRWDVLGSQFFDAMDASWSLVHISSCTKFFFLLRFCNKFGCVSCRGFGWVRYRRGRNVSPLSKKRVSWIHATPISWNWISCWKSRHWHPISRSCGGMNRIFPKKNWVSSVSMPLMTVTSVHVGWQTKNSSSHTPGANGHDRRASHLPTPSTTRMLDGWVCK